MLDELDLLSQNVKRLIEICTLYQQDLQTLQQQFSQTHIAFEQTRGDYDALSKECNALRIERNSLARKITDAQTQLQDTLKDLSSPQTEDPSSLLNDEESK